jgi:hypothetical protein
MAFFQYPPSSSLATTSLPANCMPKSHKLIILISHNIISIPLLIYLSPFKFKGLGKRRSRNTEYY